ncbi:hypothetical protein NSZ01_38080 [Nocardioides szechwanensis]|uniref:Htaa protein n=1 Tax=Nocardioides szechwanensis TaxID=1005944 RepID=A0A1H0LQI0_9ACTN|nr:HtaA domain-containing protein [Nocardioides szechwanensis]GEP36040.1 hypothetical protein NSZ01_38080 [Nocardioides szechwanensis]SDO70482.1 Htaa protein [Nocardioides szechwanensis]
MHHLKRGLSTLVATSLTAVGLAAVATAPAQAAEPLPVLTWEISQQFDDHLSTHVLTGGAEESAEGVITFPGGVGSYDAGDGTTSVAYQGSVAGSFAMAAVTYYTVTIADPIVTVDESGDGQITAVVSASNAAGMGSPAESTPPTRVVVTTFDSGTWTPGAGLQSLSATPHWAGVLAPNSPESAALGIGADKPVDGKSFNPAFLGGITSGVRAHFYASGSGSDAKKAPASFTAQVAPAVGVTTTGASYANGLDLSVAGAHFTGVTNPGDDGVYVGLAESGELPDTSSQENMALFAAVAWVPANAITDGSFVTALHAPTAKLDPSLDYSVYTWQAHAHSNTTQDTETPVTVDWSALEQQRSQATVSATWVKKPTTSTAGKLAIKVKGAAATPTGKVVIKLVRNGAVKKTFTKPLRNGAATVTLPELVAGRWNVNLRYAGSATYLAATKVLALRVTR